jgi:hypothetical protein
VTTPTLKLSVLAGSGAAGAAVWATAAPLAKAKVIKDKVVFFMGFSKIRCNPYKQTLCHPSFSLSWCGLALACPIDGLVHFIFIALSALFWCVRSDF